MNEEISVDTFEVQMNDSEIDEAIANLMELKETKQTVQIPFAEDFELIINYDDSPIEEGEDNE